MPPAVGPAPRRAGGGRRGPAARRRWARGVGVAVLLLIGGAVGADEADRAEILNVAILGRPAAGQPVTARITFRARQANVVAVIQVVEDLDGPRRVTSQREVSVVAAAFGHEEGDLLLPLVFATPGRKRVTFSLVTDEREEGERERIEVDIAP